MAGGYAGTARPLSGPCPGLEPGPLDGRGPISPGSGAAENHPLKKVWFGRGMHQGRAAAAPPMGPQPPG